MKFLHLQIALFLALLLIVLGVCMVICISNATQDEETRIRLASVHVEMPEPLQLQKTSSFTDLRNQANQQIFLERTFDQNSTNTPIPLFAENVSFTTFTLQSATGIAAMVVFDECHGFERRLCQLNENTFRAGNFVMTVTYSVDCSEISDVLILEYAPKLNLNSKGQRSYLVDFYRSGSATTMLRWRTILKLIGGREAFELNYSGVFRVVSFDIDPAPTNVPVVLRKVLGGNFCPE